MRNVVVLLALSFLSCQEKNKNIEPQRATLQQINKVSRTWATRVGMSATSEADIGKSVHDGTLFDGLLCFSGEEESCRAVKASQDDSGRFWRAPAWVGTEDDRTFSRDMALGVLAYLFKTKDREAATKWIEFIERQGNRLCPIGAGVCGITPVLWSVFYHVWTSIGLPPTNRMTLNKNTELVLAGLALPSRDYARHLIGVEAMLLQAAGNMKVHTAYALKTRSPDNPFYLWLYGEVAVSASVTLDKCPLVQPPSRRDWIWQRDDILPQRSGGWDCIFMTNLLLR